MRVLESLRGRGKEEVEIDPARIPKMLEAMKYYLERIKKIEANSEELLKGIDPDDREDPDFSKEFIIKTGKDNRIKTQEERFQYSPEPKSVKGARVTVRQAGTSEEMSPAQAYDYGSGIRFPVARGEAITGTIGHVLLQGNGTIWLEDAQLIQLPARTSNFEVQNIFTPYAGILVPTLEIELN